MTTRSRIAVLWLAAAAASLPLAPPGARASNEPIEYVSRTIDTPGGELHVRLPRGYRLDVRTPRLDRPRMLTFAPDRALIVGSPGALYRIAPPYRGSSVLARLDDYPHSVAFRGTEMLVARTGGLYRATYTAGAAALDGPVDLVAALPSGGGHASRTVRIGPRGRVYVSVGISGNCADEYLHPSYPFDRRRGGVLRLVEEAGAEARFEPYATGLRNPVGFDWSPAGKLYASNNGPDHLGFDRPVEYFAELGEGTFHGMPWFQLDDGEPRRDDCVASPPPRPAAEVARPVATFPARNAPMAVAFVPPGGLDPGMEGDAVVALRGSWGTAPDGSGSGDAGTRRRPKLVLVRFENGVAVRVDDLVTGFQKPSGERWARPVGLAFDADGQLYFSSDEGIMAVFRLTRVPR